MYRKQVRRRRAVLVLLVAVSVVLLTSTFAGSAGGPFGTIRNGIATVLGPVEEGASRALKPAQDLINWFHETFQARGENAQLKAEVAQLRKEVTNKQLAIGENRQFRGLLKLDKSSPVAGYKPVTGRVIGRSPTVWYSSVTIDVGSGDGRADQRPGRDRRRGRRQGHRDDGRYVGGDAHHRPHERRLGQGAAGRSRGRGGAGGRQPKRAAPRLRQLERERSIRAA